MSHLRPVDSETVVSMLHRQCTDNRSRSTSTVVHPDMSVEDDRSFLLSNTSSSSELNSPPSEPFQTMSEFPERNAEHCSETVVPRCPVCGKSLQLIGKDEMLLNRHVDECLNRVAVNELLASDRQTSANRSVTHLTYRYGRLLIGSEYGIMSFAELYDFFVEIMQFYFWTHFTC